MDAPGAESGLNVDDLHHAYKTRDVVAGVDLTVPAGELHCILGPSGCGKTTTLRVVAGLETIQRGRIRIDGELVGGDGLSMPPEQRRVGLMFQDFALFPHLRVLDNVMFGVRSKAAPRRKRALTMLGQVGLADKAEDYPATLSGGEQQRVALARCLATEPRLMLLDEPFSSLDAHLRERVRAEAVAVLRGSGTPTLMVTHDPDEALRVADRIHVMHDGRIVQSGSPAELYGRPVNAFVAGFFGPLNRFAGAVRDGRVTTPIGPVPAPAFADGTSVDVVIRPDALSPCRHVHDAPTLHVLGVRDVGLAHWLELKAPDGPILLARVPGLGPCSCTAGEDIGVEIDARHIFVYAAGT
jgi:iron(III) transport system ATP-binding protein